MVEVTGGMMGACRYLAYSELPRHWWDLCSVEQAALASDAIEAFAKWSVEGVVEDVRIVWKPQQRDGVATAWVDVPPDFLSGLRKLSGPSRFWQHAAHGKSDHVRLSLSSESKLLYVESLDGCMMFNAAALMRELWDRGVRL